MQPEILAEQRVAVGAVALLAAVVYGLVGARTSGCAENSVAARYAVAVVAIAIAGLVLFGSLSPAAAYGALCLAIVSVYVVDLFRRERAVYRRVASLTRRPAAGAVATVWIATAAASSFMLAPYVILAEQRIAAFLVGLCSFTIAGIAWRVATAPAQLSGENLEGERLRDRLDRSLRSGVAAELALGNVFVFISFENAELLTVLPLQHALLFVSEALWVACGIWVIKSTLAVRHARRSDRSFSPAR